MNDPTTLTSIAPANGAVLGEAGVATPPDVVAAVSGAREAQLGWERTGAVRRAAAIVELGRLISRDAESLAHTAALEVGKPLAEARAEVDRAAAIAAYYGGVGNELGGDLRRSGDPLVMVLARQVPIGVAGVITPWNFPIAIPAWKIIPALTAGCTVVWKPAPEAIVTAAALAELVREAGIDDSVLAVVNGDAETGAALVGADLDGLSFTGSSVVGEGIRRSVGARPLRLTLELGGVNIAHVLADADLAATADAICAAAFGYAGQKCTATQVIAVDRTVSDELEGALAERLAGLSIGDPLDGAPVGPVIDTETATQLRATIAELSHDCVVHRAEAPGDGAWVAPTLIVEERERLPREELFGPVATLVATDSIEDHRRLVASSPSALSAAVYGRDVDGLRQMVNVAATAVVAVNRPSTGLDPHVPFGGWGASAGGFSEQGIEALRAYSKWQTVYWSGAPGGEFP